MVLELKELQEKKATLKKFYYSYKGWTSKDISHILTQFPCNCMRVPDTLWEQSDDSELVNIYRIIFLDTELLLFCWSGKWNSIFSF